MSRQSEWYNRNRDHILEKRKTARLEANPKHPWKGKTPVLAPKKTDIDRMLDELEKDRRKFGG